MPLWLIAVDVVLLGLAVVLMKRGWWPRRTGADPHCRRCGYNLSGVLGTNCPECGVDLTRETRRLGSRRRRPAIGGVGAVLLLLVLVQAAAVLWVVGRGVNVYSYFPERLLIAWLDRPGQAKECWVELMGRARSLTLSPRGEADWIEKSIEGVLDEWSGSPTPLYSEKVTQLGGAAAQERLPIAGWRKLVRALGERGIDRLRPVRDAEVSILKNALAFRVLEDVGRRRVVDEAIRSIDSGSPLQPEDAVAVLEKALAARALHDDETRRFLDAALEAYRNDRVVEPINNMLMYSGTAMPDAEFVRFVAQMVGVTVRPRPQNMHGQPIRWTYTLHARGPSSLSFRVRGVKLSVDDTAVGTLDIEDRLRNGSTRTGTDRLASLSPGWHRLRMEAAVDVESAAPLGPQPRQAKTVCVGEARFHVRTPEEGDEVVLLEEPAVVAGMRQAVRVRAAEWAYGEQYRHPNQPTPRPPGLMVILDTDRAAVPIAFELWAIVNGEWHAMSPVSAVTGTPLVYSYGETVPAVDQVELVLRASAAVARDTVDVSRICGGELRIEGVRVRLPPDLRGDR